MLGMNKSHRHSLGLDRAALVSADDLVGIKPFRAEPCADLEVGHDRRLRAPRDLQASWMWSKWPWVMSMRSHRSTFFSCSGATGLFMTQGSMRTSLPLALRAFQVP